MRRTVTLAAAVLLLCSAGAAPVSKASVFKVGAAKVDITPAADQLPKGVEGIHDHIFARAIALQNGTTRAALVTLDLGAITPDTWAHISKRVEKEVGIPSKNLLLTATHTHSAFFMGQGLEDDIIKAIREAEAKAQPAQMAFGTGVSYINVQRDMIDGKTRRWWEGANYDGVSDKSVGVVKFSTLAGKPIAVYYNYGVHAVLTGQMDQIGGDIPGATSSYIEDSLGDGAVAVWSNGAAGDQNPIFFQQTYDLRDIRIKEFASRGIDISNAMPPGGQGLNKKDPRVALLMNQQAQMSASMGQMLGEEVLHVMRESLQRPSRSTAIVGVQKSVTCPGRKQTNSGRAGYQGTYEDAAPVPILLSMLKVGNVVIGGVDGEVYSAIALRFKKESPVKNSMFVTLTNGSAPSGYIPDDAAYGHNTFEVLSSRLKPGCAETSIVDGLLDLMETAGAE